jgi:hypothetical protein
VPRAVSWDIARARESVEVYCAFLNPEPVRKRLREFATPLAGGAWACNPVTWSTAACT